MEREAGVFNQEADELRNTYSTGEIGLEVGRKIYKGHYGMSLDSIGINTPPYIIDYEPII